MKHSGKVLYSKQRLVRFWNIWYCVKNSAGGPGTENALKKAVPGVLQNGLNQLQTRVFDTFCMVIMRVRKWRIIFLFSRRKSIFLPADFLTVPLSG